MVNDGEGPRRLVIVVVLASLSIPWTIYRTIT